MSDNPLIHVRSLLITPIKGLRVSAQEELVLERAGVREDRRFYLVDESGRLFNGKRAGELTQLRSEYRDGDRNLTLRLPGGEEVSGQVQLGAEIAVGFFRRELQAPLVLGPWSDAISAHVGRPLRLVEADLAQNGVDRGRRGTVSLVSQASLERLAAVAGNGSEIDPRRFRMLVEIDGVGAHAEDAWVGRRARIGEALVAFNGHVGRCLVTRRDPDTGTIDLPTLDLISQYRGEEPTTEPLPFGIYGEVLESGTVRLGDPIILE